MLATRRKAFADRLPLVQRAAAADRHRRAGRSAASGRRRDRAGRDRRRRRRLRRREAARGCWPRLKDVRALVDAPERRRRDHRAARPRPPRLRRAAAGSSRRTSVGRAWTSEEGARAHRRRARRRQARMPRRSPRRRRTSRSRFDRFGQRIAAISPLLQVMIPRVAGLGREQRAEAQDIADRRARRPAAAHRRLHDAGALRARPALRPRLRQDRMQTMLPRPSRSLRARRGRRLAACALSACWLFRPAAARPTTSRR